MDNVIALLLLLIAAFLGYSLRVRELQKEKRLQIYGDVIGTFLGAAHSGAALHSMHTQLGPNMFEGDAKPETERRWDEWASDAHGFESAGARLRLIGSAAARAEAERLEKFIEENIRKVPPMWTTDGTKGWGESAKVGPAQVEADALSLARQFSDRFAPEVVGRSVSVRPRR